MDKFSKLAPSWVKSSVISGDEDESALGNPARERNEKYAEMRRARLILTGNTSDSSPSSGLVPSESNLSPFISSPACPSSLSFFLFFSFFYFVSLR